MKKIEQVCRESDDFTVKVGVLQESEIDELTKRRCLGVCGLLFYFKNYVPTCKYNIQCSRVNNIKYLGVTFDHIRWNIRITHNAFYKFSIKSFQDSWKLNFHCKIKLINI